MTTHGPTSEDDRPTIPATGMGSGGASPEQTAANTAHDSEATIPADLAATRITQNPDSDPNATLATHNTDEAATRPAQTEDADRTRPMTDHGTDNAPSGTEPFRMGTSAPTTSGLTRGTGTFTRAIRTKINTALPADTQLIDKKLQLSRTSVLSDMVATSNHKLPKGLTKRIQSVQTEARYAVEKPLAAGGMGAVLRIDDHDFHRQAAMKIMHGQFTQSGDAMARFLAEAQVTAQLEHPNIVPIHDMGIMEDGSLYFTMKLIEGDSLGKIIKLLKGDKKGDVEIPPNPDAVAAWSLEAKLLVFLKVLDGVGFANSRGVVHRDIKPDNIMLGSHGEVLVVDWGIAKVLNQADTTDDLVRHVATIRQGGEDAKASETMSGSAMGTIYYMPPEQAAGEVEAIGAWSDVYALGATLYEFLCLHRPVKSQNLANMVNCVIAGETLPITQFYPDIDADLHAIIQRSMHITPQFRYPDCASFSDDIKRFMAGQAVAARERNILERFGAWYRLHKRLVHTSAAAIVLLAGSSVATVYYQEHANALVVQQRLESAETLSKQGDRKALDEASLLLTEAKALQPNNTTVAEAAIIVKQQRDVLAAEEARTIEARAAAGKAQVLLGEALELQRANDFEGAKERLDAARRLQPEDELIDAARNKVIAALSDSRLRSERAAAQTAKQQGDAIVAHIRTLTIADPAIEAALRDAEAAYALSGKDGHTADDIQDALGQLVLLRQAITQQQQQAQAVRDGERLLAAATAALTADNLQAARDQAAAAVEQLQGRTDAAELLATVMQRQQQAADLAAAQAALREAEIQASAQLQRANQELMAIVAAKNELDTAVQQRDQAGSNHQQLVRAQQAVRGAQQAVAEHWQTCEAAAQSAITLLKDNRDQVTVQKSRALLADLYLGRLDEARRTGRLPEIAAFTNLLQRFDDGRYAAQRTGVSIISWTGVPGSIISVTPQTINADGRIVAAGKPRSVTLPLAADNMPSGRYLIESPLVSWSYVATPGPQTVAIPALAPISAAPPLRWVAGDASHPAFLLSQHEITQADYAQFLNDSAILPKVLGQLIKEFEANESGDARPELFRIPRLTLTGPSTWEPIEKKGNFVGVQPRDNPSLPVTGISRADAQAYCAWLSAKTHTKVRLPTQAEWQFAAQNDDVARQFPWGDTFDPALSVTAFDTPAGANFLPLPVGSKPSDCGAFGHLDMGGNVYEWLADDLGRIGGLIAGGSCSADQAADFLCIATMSAEPAGVYSPIGFRIVIENP